MQIQKYVIVWGKEQQKSSESLFIKYKCSTCSRWAHWEIIFLSLSPNIFFSIDYCELWSDSQEYNCTEERIKTIFNCINFHSSSTDDAGINAKKAEAK